MALLGPLTTVDWLAANLSRPDVKVLDGTWIMPGTDLVLPGGFIPGAQFFDVDKIADLKSSMKHMLPPAHVFEAAMSRMGIENDDTIIVYDRHGIRSSPRLWWTLRMFGHANTAALDGGLPAWIEAGYPVSDNEDQASSKTSYKAKQPLSSVSTQDEIMAILGTDTQIIDARSSGRFYGTEPEPRAGLRSGHIPGSRSWPVSNVWDGIFLQKTDELKRQIKVSNLNPKQKIITSCGSGMTAAVLALALEIVGAENISIYDGSWTEWGASDAPVSTADN